MFLTRRPATLVQQQHSDYKKNYNWQWRQMTNVSSFW